MLLLPIMALLSHKNHLNPFHVPFDVHKPKFTVSSLSSCNHPSASLCLTSTIASTQGTVTSNPDKTIRSLCLLGQLGEAIKVFTSSENHKFEEQTYISLIRLCRLNHAVPEGCGVFARLSSSETHFSLHVGNHLLHMLIKFEKLITAWIVFDKMPQKNVFSWNIMVSGYGKAGFLREAIDLYQRMLWACVRPDLYTFPCVLRCCGSLPDLRSGKAVHAHVIRYRYGLEVDVTNALITMYGKCGDLSRARKVFDEMSIRDCVSWNAIVALYFENYEYAKGIELFLTMVELCLEPSLFTMTSVISHCELGLGETLHGYTIKTGFALDHTVCNCLIKMYSNSTRIDEAMKVFSRINDKSLFSWTVMISGYEQNGLPGKALELFQHMELDNVTPDEATIASVLAACARVGEVDIGIRLHKLAQRKGLETSSKVATSLIYFYTKSQCIDQAVEVFKRLPHKDVFSYSALILGFNINRRHMDSLWYFRNMHCYVQPNDVTFMGALDACAHLGAMKCGKEIHARALRDGFGFKGCLPNSILAMYAKCGRMDDALSQFHVIHGWNDVVS